MVSPLAGLLPAHHIEELWCQPVAAEMLDRWGRCIELIHLSVAGLQAEAVAKQPEHQWPITLDLDPRPEDMGHWC